MSDTPLRDELSVYLCDSSGEISIFGSPRDCLEVGKCLERVGKLERELSIANDKNGKLCAIISPAQRALAVVSQFRKCIEDPNSFFMDLCGKPEPIAQLTEIYDALKKALEPFDEQTPGCGHMGVTQ